MTEMTAPVPYPVRLDVEYTTAQSRWKALLRLPLSIPILIFAYLLQSSVALAIWAAILVRGRIPHWLFDFQVALNRWQLRAGAYLLLLTDAYPPFEGDYPVRYEVAYPERPSRWRLVVWKFITSVPHLFVLIVLALTLLVVVPIGWFAILIVGRFPQGLHWYVAGVLRWGARVNAYILSLTDKFPPFSLSAEAGAGGTSAYVSSSVIGVLAAAGVIAGIVTIAIVGIGEHPIREVSYQRLLAGEVMPVETYAEVNSAVVELIAAADPADDRYPFLVAQPDHRFVEFALIIENVRPTSQPDLREDCFSLKDSGGDWHDALLFVLDGRVPPIKLAKHEFGAAEVLFEVPIVARPAKLRYQVLDCTTPIFPAGETITYEFR